jgi:hypothetical protein
MYAEELLILVLFEQILQIEEKKHRFGFRNLHKLNKIESITKIIILVLSIS